ncbi:MAG: non-hydrolyzing UDP-N-acetylglucosamine 2-epimerase [Gemmatimonadota bacterium]
MKILSVFGTRPEAIKMAPVVRELRRASADSDVQAPVCVTAQHREMLDQVLEIFGIEPEYDLRVMEEDQTPARVAAGVLRGLEAILDRERPDWVLVQGDTTTVAAAALAAFYAGVRVGHVEAGLRTFDRRRPFPEEINRRVAGVLADLHFAPTAAARDNLLREGIPTDRVLVTGNPVIDALQWIVARLPEEGPAADGIDMARIAALPPETRLVLVTAHRRESFGRPLEEVYGALRELAERYGDGIRLVYPAHLNPNVQEPVHRLLGDVPNITLAPPLPYLPLVWLMRRAHFILTDSGGIQEEAPALGVPVLVLREVTERPEAVEAGAARIVGTHRETILAEATRLLEDEEAHAGMAKAVNPFGDGRAGERIVGAVLGEPVEAWAP